MHSNYAKELEHTYYRGYTLLAAEYLEKNSNRNSVK